jgi:hypothetical protein
MHVGHNRLEILGVVVIQCDPFARKVFLHEGGQCDQIGGFVARSRQGRAFFACSSEESGTLDGDDGPRKLMSEGTAASSGAGKPRFSEENLVNWRESLVGIWSGR